MNSGMPCARRASAVALTAGVVLSAGAFLAPARAATPKAPSIHARGGYVMNGASGRTYFAKAADTRRSTGSTTKIMTADVVLGQQHLDLNREVTVRMAYSDYIVSKGASSAHLIVGDRLTVRQLLDGMLLPSGCDAAYALADTYGSGATRSARVRSFIGKMNAKAKELGLKNTHFDSFDGIGNGANYSTPRDLTKIASDAMKNATFRSIVATRSTKQKVTTENGGYRYMKWSNTDTLLGRYPGEIGVKTGSGPEAGYCLVFAAARHGRTVIGTVLDSTSLTARASDAERLMDYGFAR